MIYLIRNKLALFAFASIMVVANASVAAEAGVNDTDDAISISSASEVRLTGGEMEGNRGAAGMNAVSSSQTLSSISSGNSLNVSGNLTNGNISVGENMGGFGSYIMNTGNNTTINTAVSLNVQITPSAAP